MGCYGDCLDSVWAEKISVVRKLAAETWERAGGTWTLGAGMWCS